MPIVHSEKIGNVWLSKSDYSYYDAMLNPKPETFNGKTYPAVCGFNRNGSDSFLIRTVRNRTIAKCKQSQKLSTVVLRSDIDQYRESLPKIVEAVRFSVNVREPVEHVLKVSEVGTATFELFAEKRKELSKVESDYEEARRAYIRYSKTFNSQPLIRKIKDCEKKIKQYQSELAEVFSNDVKEWSKKDFVRYAFFLNAGHMVKVYQVEIARLEVIKEENAELLRMETVKDALEADRDRLKKLINTKKAWFKAYKLDSNGKKTLTAGVKNDGKFLFCNLNKKVTET